MKHPEDLHRDYKPMYVLNCEKLQTIQGAVVLLRFKKVKNLYWYEVILRKICIVAVKDVYFWLPYKSVLENNTKYSVIGSNKRFPYANLWFEVKESSPIYKQGLNKYTFTQLQIRNAALKGPSHMTVNMFVGDELVTVTKKSVIRKLDAVVFNETTDK